MATKYDKLLDVALRRGFFFPSAEIYRGIAGVWTYGHAGTSMKRKFENLWRDFFLKLNDNFHEIDGSYILPQKVFEASGHLKNFNDPLTECKYCHTRYRADNLLEESLKGSASIFSLDEMDKMIKQKKVKCPNCGKSDFLKTRWFNMMFDLRVGATGHEIGYLSPETAQNPFISFKREFSALREKLPLGLAMIGRAYRNEISPRQAFFRMREFTQAELQIFFNPANLDAHDGWKSVKGHKLRLLLAKGAAKGKITEITLDEANRKLKLPKFYLYHLAQMQKFYLDVMKVPKDKLRLRELHENERAFYNKLHFDVELDIESLGGFKEVAGCHYRSDYDLAAHQRVSGEKLEVLHEEKRFVPHVLEISFGVDRNIFALLDLSFREDAERTWFTFPASLAPMDACVFPLVSKDGLPELAEAVYESLKKDFKAFYDESGSIGKRYRRADELGIPYCITIDHDSLKKKDVTVRMRDSMKQARVKIGQLPEYLNKAAK
jgi:glycyl-tRNA synthetase